MADIFLLHRGDIGPEALLTERAFSGFSVSPWEKNGLHCQIDEGSFVVLDPLGKHRSDWDDVVISLGYKPGEFNVLRFWMDQYEALFKLLPYLSIPEGSYIDNDYGLIVEAGRFFDYYSEHGELDWRRIDALPGQ